MTESTGAPPGRRAGRPLRLLGLLAGLAFIVVAGIVAALHDRVAGAALSSAARGLGYDVHTGSLRVGLGRTVIDDLRLERRGEPVFAARHVDVRYSLRDLLPGGSRLLGLQSVSVQAPRVTLIHHPDGSYNFVLPNSSAQPATSNGPPLDLAFHVSDGSVELIDRFVSVSHERRERIAGVHADGAISAVAVSRYTAGAVLETGGHRYPISGNARFDDPRGFEVQHFTAARLPIAGLADFALSTHAIVVQAGEIEHLDVKLGALRGRGGAMQSHSGLSGVLRAARLAATALAKPIRDAHGAFVVDTDGASVRALDASLNGVAIHLSGAVYDFASPQIALGVTVRGDLSQVRQLSRDVAKLPLHGKISVVALAEGAAAAPLIVARLSAPHVGYGAFRFDGARGLVAVSGQELDVLASGVRYGNVALGGRAAVRLERHTLTTAYATVGAPPNSLPYLNQIVPGLPLAATAVVHGTDARIGARGYAGGQNGGDRLDLPFTIAADRSGTVGPVVLQRRDGASIYARVALDPGARRTLALVDVRRASLFAGPAVELPGLQLPRLPAALDGRLDATLVASATGTTLTSANGRLHAYGSWGDVAADADGAAPRLAARGRFTSSFGRLAAFTGGLGARGTIDVPFALTSAGRATIVQVQDARFSGGSIRGIPLEGASATVGVGSGAIDIYSADLRAAGRDLTAQGRFGAGGHVHVTAGDVDLRTLRAAGLAAAGGRATLIADLGGTVARPTANVLGALDGARYAGTLVGGDVGLAYDGAALRVERATLTYGGAYADAGGTIGGLALGHFAPRYALRAGLEDADIATLARTVKNPLRYPEGTLNADMRVSGAGTRPSVRGTLRIPEGSLNGLTFGGGAVAFAGDTQALRADDGRVTVGSTSLHFHGAASRSVQSGALRAPRINLADFDDYFDEADVLTGTGSLQAAVSAAPNRLDASADVALAGVRYRRFTIGRVAANVRTAGTAIRLRGAITSPNGSGRLTAQVNVPHTDPLRDTLRRSDLDVDGAIARINLGNVLPAAGITAPVFGFVDGSARVRGRFPGLNTSLRASLSHGVAGRLPIERLELAATTANGRGRLNQATLVAPGINAALGGSFGLRPADAFDIRARLTSPDIETLASAATGKAAGLRGALDTRAHLTGTLAQPHVAANVDLTALTYATVSIPSVHADIDATRRGVDVRHGTIVLPRSGTIAFDGHAPLETGPRTPVALDFTPHNVNVAPYSSLLPDGSVLGGIFDGSVGVRGTLGAPQLGGRLTFNGGSYRSNTLRSPLTAVGLELDFAGTTIRIPRLHAHAAPGNFDGSGTVRIGDLRDPLRGLSADLTLKAANAVISAPKYYVGYIDGTVAVTKQAAAPTLVGGNLTFSSARIPYTALAPSGGAAGTAAPVVPDVDFDLGVNVGRDLRIASGPVDIGAAGSARLGGTLAKPTLDGVFTATDGTVAVYRTFSVQNGSSVSFNAADGITPSLDATAVTHVPDPSTDVLLRITGLSTHLNLAFTSQPAYTQQQILGLLVNAQALGAVSGVAQSGPAGSNAPSISGIGEGLVNDQLTKAFLQPLSSKLGGALGLSDLDVNYNTNGAVSAIARRKLGKNISFTYGEQIGGPTPRTSVGINIGSAIAGAQLTFFQASGSAQAFGGQSLTPFLQSGFLATSSPNYTLEAIAPPSGSGFVFSYVHRFWARAVPAVSR